MKIMKRMKRILLPICLLGCMAVSAQRQEGSDFNAFRAEVMERRAERLANDLDLKDQAKADFKALYNKFQEEMFVIIASEFQTRSELERKKIDDLTDDEAMLRVKNMFDRKTQSIVNSYNRLEIEKKYYAEFAKTMNNKQLLKIFEGSQNFRQRMGNNRQRNRQGGMNFGGGNDAFGGDFNNDFGGF